MSDSEMNEGMQTEAQAPEPGPVSPGARLAATREANGWSIEQVASYLKLAPRQVAAIERDDYAALPGMPIVRGFVRSYAKLLKMDAAPLLAQLGGETMLASESLKPKEGLAAPFSEARLPSMSDKPAMSSKWVVGVLLLILVGVAFWAFRQKPAVMELPPSPAGESETVVEPVEPPASASAGSDAPVVPTEPASPPAADEADAAAQVQPDQDQAATTAPGPSAAVEQVASAPAPASAPASAPAPTDDILNLTVREESWIEIRRADGGRVVTARLAQPGENITVNVAEPVELVVGNAAGVDATLRGEPLELKGSTKTNVARLNLK